MIGVGKIGTRASRGGGGTPPNPDFVFTVDTTQAGSAADTMVLPLLSGGTYSGTIDWGDGSTSALSYANRSHTYAAGGTYTITLSGTIEGWAFNNSGDRRKINAILSWGNFIASGTGAFFGCSNLTVSATDAPTLSGDALRVFFGNCTSLTTEDFSHWDTSACTGLISTFFGCTSFNGDVTTWDVSSCTSFSGGATGTFTNCSVFNQDISGWDVGSVTNFTAMFQSAVAFNQNIGSWNMSSAQTIQKMFLGATSFDNGGSDDIGNWNVSNINTMREAFRKTNFQRDISGWDVSNVTSFYDTFAYCRNFNADISGWNLDNCTNMYQMLYDCDSFDRSLASWGIANVTTMFRFMTAASGLSTANYDATLIGWEATLQAAYPGGVGYPNPININFGGSQYTLGGAGETARTILINIFGWTITDGGGI